MLQEMSALLRTVHNRNTTVFPLELQAEAAKQLTDLYDVHSPIPRTLKAETPRFSDVLFWRQERQEQFKVD